MPYKDRDARNANNRKWYWAHRDQRKAAIRKYEEANKDKLAAYRKKWREKKDRDWGYGCELRSIYKITIEEYNALLEAQHGKCAICGRDQNWRDRWGTTKRRFCVDHDHVTTQVRGLLCDRCNIGLSKFDDNIDWLRAAAAYLEEHHPDE